VAQLLEAGAEVVVVSPEVTERIRRWAEEGRLRWVARPYRWGDLEGAWLGVSAPEDRATNAAVWEEAQARRVWLNAVDDPLHCSVIAPAVYRQGGPRGRGLHLWEGSGAGGAAAETGSLHSSGRSTGSFWTSWANCGRRSPDASPFSRSGRPCGTASWTRRSWTCCAEGIGRRPARGFGSSWRERDEGQGVPGGGRPGRSRAHHGARASGAPEV
jgi:hypothetical protein